MFGNDYEAGSLSLGFFFHDRGPRLNGMSFSHCVVQNFHPFAHCDLSTKDQDLGRHTARVSVEVDQHRDDHKDYVRRKRFCSTWILLPYPGLASVMVPNALKKIQSSNAPFLVYFDQWTRGQQET